MTINSTLKRLAACTSMVAGLCLLVPAMAAACEADAMAKTDSGFVKKVVAGSDQIKAYKTDAAVEEAFDLELMQPYFVICENAELLRITAIPTQSVEEAMSAPTGFVKKTQVEGWTTREALSFSDIAFLEDRPEILAWYEKTTIDKFMETGNKKLHAPDFQENLDDTRKRERSTRPYPVLSSEMQKLGGRKDKRVFNVLLPVALTPTDTIVIDKNDEKTAETALRSATILLVFDATGSMEGTARAVARSIKEALDTLPQGVREGTTMGFVFFRDEGDADKLVEVPPLPLAEAADALDRAAGAMNGGGDVSEPILDALYYAANLYDWGQAGFRVAVGVLNGDAKPRTIGTLDDRGRIPADLDSLAISKYLADASIPTITMQADAVAGETLRAVLGTISEETGGVFIDWGAGDQTEKLASALTVNMSRAAADKLESGEKALSKVEYDTRGYPTIPLEVLDGEMLERLRAVGVRFNINRADGGVLVQQGYMIENDDLLEPQIQIEKETLQGLINLYSVLGTVGVDADAMRESASQAIAAIAGEDFDPEEAIQETIRKRLGIQFRSELLNFNMEYLDALLPAERLKLTKRIQDASTTLGQYLEANLAEFDTQPAVWMPVDVLP